MDGKVRVYDIENPRAPKVIYERKIGSQVNMVSQSWDGERIYFTSSLLANWDELKSRFRKVIPRQYKLVLEALENAQRTGVDPDVAVMATAQGG